METLANFRLEIMSDEEKSKDTMTGFEPSIITESQKNSLSYYFDRFNLNSRASKDVSNKTVIRKGPSSIVKNKIGFKQNLFMF
ncbi:hypothetical protein MHBO_001746 [Bonamia ostreae]|uniref:Uncharacterized protein n=1 Tax=Bonamia ostreae TaxID=126728 RepID=A0ABV2AK12_9EUKA